MIRTVAVGTDGSSTAAKAVKEAAYLARRLDAKLVLLSASGDSWGAPRGGSGNVELEWAANTSARVSTILADGGRPE